MDSRLHQVPQDAIDFGFEMVMAYLAPEEADIYSLVCHLSADEAISRIVDQYADVEPAVNYMGLEIVRARLLCSWPQIVHAVMTYLARDLPNAYRDPT